MIVSSAAGAVVVTGGSNGTHSGSAYGATAGTGGSSSTATISSSPGTNTGSQCIDVRVTKTVSPTAVVPGQPVTYTITVSNAGPYPATGTTPVAVTDTLPAGLNTPTWTCAASVGSSCASVSGSGSLATTANLAVGGSAVYTVSGTLSPSFTGTLSNTVTVAGPGSVPELNAVDNTATVNAALAPRVNMVKTSDVSGFLYDGDVVTYTIRVENPSSNPIAGVVVTDVLPPGLVYEPGSTTVQIPASSVTRNNNPSAPSTPLLVDGTPSPGSLVAAGDALTLPPGATMTVTYRARVDASAVPSGGTTVTNGATFDAPSYPGNETSSVTDPLALADLSLVKTDDGPVAPGGQITYTITVTNAGPHAALGTVVADTLDPNVSVSSVTPSQGACSALPCDLGTVGVGGAATVTVVATVAATAPTGGSLEADANEPGLGDCTGADVCNVATVSSRALDWDGTDDGDDEPTDVAPPVLLVDKPAPILSSDADASGDISAGDTLTYTITATNPNAVALTNVVVSDGLITPTGGSTPCGIVAPGGTCTLVGTYLVAPADVVAGSIMNTATADSDQTVAVMDGETTPVPAPGLSVVKPAPVLSADADGSGDISAGDTLTYTITATNTGAANLTDVVVTDGLITPTGGTTPCGLVVPAGTCTLVGTYVVTPADVVFGSIVNTATADSDQTPAVMDGETTPLLAPGLSVDKPAPSLSTDADASGDVSVGDTLTYTITATNTGAANLTDVVVTDGMITPAGGSTPCALVAAGWHVHADRDVRGDAGGCGGGFDREHGVGGFGSDGCGDGR